MLKHVLLAWALATTAAATAQGGPFGVEMGTPVDQLTIIRKLSNTYYIISPPLKNSRFHKYAVLTTPQRKVCLIGGIGVSIPNDPSGLALKAEYANLHEALTKKYGESTFNDLLLEEAIWKEPSQYALSLSEDERFVSSFWSNKQGSTLPPGLESITLEAHSDDGRETHVSLTYRFSNIKECLPSPSPKDDEAL